MATVNRRISSLSPGKAIAAIGVTLIVIGGIISVALSWMNPSLTEREIAIEYWPWLSSIPAGLLLLWIGFRSER